MIHCIFCDFNGTLNELKEHSAVCENHPAVKKLNLLQRASKALIDRLDEIHSNSLYKFVWESFMIHGGDYSKGPKYDKELEYCIKVLRKIDEQKDTSRRTPCPVDK